MATQINSTYHRANDNLAMWSVMGLVVLAAIAFAGYTSYRKQVENPPMYSETLSQAPLTRATVSAGGTMPISNEPSSTIQ